MILLTSNITLSIPDIVMGIALLSSYGKNGLMGILFGNIFVNSAIGIVIAEIYIMLPYSINIVYSVFKNTNKSYVESAYALGATRFDVLRYIYIKLNKFLLIKSILLNISYGMSIFGVILIFSYYPKVMTTEIFEKFQLFEYNKALVFSSYLIILSFLIYAIVLLLEYKDNLKNMLIFRRKFLNGN
ncbi:MAG: ABC transporter permease subunit [Nanopusillaceae archaeon]